METIAETIKTPEISLPSTETNGHTNGAALQEAILREEPSVATSTLKQKPEHHPWLDVLGKYEGEEWEEFRAQMKKIVNDSTARWLKNKRCTCWIRIQSRTRLTNAAPLFHCKDA